MKKQNRVGLGTFPLADVFTKINPAKAEEIVKSFLDNGGYYIDTAPLYGFGQVEKIIGEAVKDFRRDDYYIATKCGYIDVEGKTFSTVQKSGKYKDVLRECDKSLKRLQLDYVDLYFVHSPDPNTPFSETMRALLELQKQGKVKDLGVSNVNSEELKEYCQSGKIKYVQNRFSLINRSIKGELEKFMLDSGIKLVPYQVIDRGQLSGKVFEGFKLKEGDLRIGRSDWVDDKLNVISDWVKVRLAPISKELGITIGQLAMAWALHQKYTGFLIVGTTNTEQLKLNLDADKVKLPREVINRIDKAYKELEKDIKNKFGIEVHKFRGLNDKYY
jgi:aryl-alcohol dehydrogenase-like predicted oxidoreductase